MTIHLEERITSHDTYIKIERIIQLVDTIIENKIPSGQVQDLEKLSETFNILKEGIDRADPLLFSLNSLKNMNSHVSNILNELTNFIKSKNIQHLNNTNIHLDNIVPFFSQIMVSRTPEDIEGVRNSVISFRKSIGQHLANVEKEINETSNALATSKEKLNELTISVDSQKSRIDSIINNLQDQFIKGQNERSKQFNKLIQNIDTDFGTTVESIEKEFENQLTINKESFSSVVENIKSKMDEEFENIKKMNKEAEKIVGIISMKGLASGYQKIANDEGRKSFWWNIGSIFSIIAVIFFGVFFILLHEGTLEWTILISRIVLSGFGLTLFTYCAKQASYYRSEERRNRKIELELASLNPYLKDLGESEQKKVKENLVSKYFGVELPNATGKQEQTNENIVNSITPQQLQLLADKLSQFKSTK